MPNYKEETVAGNKWRRCRQIVIDNTLGNTPRLVFQEQDVIDLGGGEYVSKDVFSVPAMGFFPLATQFDQNTSIQIYNPLTGQPTGQTMTHGEIYAILYSAYMDAALRRDAAEEQPEPPVE